MTIAIIFWLICGGVAAGIASSRGASVAIGAIVGFLLGPLGVVVSCFLPPSGPVQQLTMKKCPRCAELVQREALVCRYCGHEFDPNEVIDATPPLAAQPPAPAIRKEGSWVAVFAGVAAILIAIAFGAVLMVRQSDEGHNRNAETERAVAETQLAEETLAHDLEELNGMAVGNGNTAKPQR